MRWGGKVLELSKIHVRVTNVGRKGLGSFGGG